MDRINNELSEIAYAMQKLASDAHLAPKPTWEQIADHIAHNRFPEEGLKLNGDAIGRAVREAIKEGAPDVLGQNNQAWVTIKGRPDLYLGYSRSFLGPEMRETYLVLMANSLTESNSLLSTRDRLEGLVVTGSPSKLHPYVQIQEHTIPHGPATLRDYPRNIIPSNVEDHRKSVVMRTLRRIGL